MSNLEHELNNMLEDVLRMLFQLIRSFGILFCRLLKSVFWGIPRLKYIPYFLGFLGAGGVSFMTYFFKDRLLDVFQRIELASKLPWIIYVPYVILLGLPVLYLCILGSGRNQGQEKYRKEFERIGFRTKNGEYPYLVKRVREKQKKRKGKEKVYKETYIFKSSIPLSVWMAAKEQLETALNCNIIRFAEGKSKKVVCVVTVPSQCHIPTKISWQDALMEPKDGVMVVGEGALDQVSFDLNKTPHVLAAGETGSGKSVILRLLLWQMAAKGSRIYMFDFKGGIEFGIPYERFGRVVTNLSDADCILDELLEENGRRMELFRRMDVKNLPQYNRQMGSNLCRIGVFCDEIAEMMDGKGKKGEDKKLIESIEGKISTLARLARATGINLFLGVQRPDANVLTGQIKNNIPIRICGRFADRSASEIVLGNTDAVYLPDIKGRFLFRLGNQTSEFQAYLFEDEKHLRNDVEIKQGDLICDMPYQDMHQDTEDAKEKPTQIKQQKKEVERKKQCEKNRLDEFDFSWSCEGKEQE